MIFINDNTFHLQNDALSYVMSVHNGYLTHLYYGQRLPHQENFDWLRQSPSEPVGNAVFLFEGDGMETLSRYRLEYPTFGEGDYREPALQVEDVAGSRMCSLQYAGHRVCAEKPELEGLPATRVTAPGQAEVLELELADKVSGLTVTLRYTLFTGKGALVRQARIDNRGTETIVLDRAFSGAIDFPNAAYDLSSFHGDWIKERQLTRRPLQHGVTAIDSKKGVSSSWQNPFFMLSDPKATEFSGDVFGFALMYSGSFKALCEVDPHENLRIQMGINDFDFSWSLAPGAGLDTPEWILLYSGDGFNGMSQMSHQLVNQQVVPPQWQGRTRPVLINNWEATYFNFNEEKLLQLADAAAAVGVELFVLDDGWFKGRNDDTTSLGDWTVDLQKLPSGLKALSDQVKEKGLQFGIWVEPEMISKASDLYEAHPDWLIAVPGRVPKHGRNQFILDLSREEVVDYLLGVLTQVLQDSGADYVKWDMNRTFSDLYSTALPKERQKELGHRYVLGLYKLMDALTKQFPEVLFEFCSAGGNRFDLGMMYYMPQGWTSDNTDAIERQGIQYATSYAYPISTMGAHVSAVPNHQTGRMTPLATRFDVAMFGVLGYELDLTQLSEAELAEIKGQIAQYKTHRELIQFGSFYRLVSPFEGNNTGWMSVAKDKQRAVAGYYKKMTQANPNYRHLKMTGLDPNALYKVTGAGVNCENSADRSVLISGAALMGIGLPLRPEYNGTVPTERTWWFGDYGACVFTLEAVAAL